VRSPVPSKCVPALGESRTGSHDVPSCAFSPDGDLMRALQRLAALPAGASDPVAAAPRGPDRAPSPSLRPYCCTVLARRCSPCVLVGCGRHPPVYHGTARSYGDRVGIALLRLCRPAAGCAAPLPVTPPRCQLRRPAAGCAVLVSLPRWAVLCAQSGGRRIY
jgi:hypothetical protein